MAQPRERAPNFSAQEKLSLLEIIHDYKDIIESKKTDSVNWKDKEIAWQEVTTKFNALALNIKRSKQSLQKYYENQKKNVRKSVAFERQELLKTGGGKPNVNNTDPSNEMLLSIINAKTVSGVTNRFDGDKAVFETAKISTSCDKSQDNISLNNSDQLICTNFEYLEDNENDNNEIPTEEISNKIDWGNSKASNLKAPLRKKLLELKAEQKEDKKWTPRRRPTLALHSSHLSQQYSDLAAVKLELAILQRDAFKAEIEAKHNREQVEFELKKKSLELDIQIKQKKLNSMRIE